MPIDTISTPLTLLHFPFKFVIQSPTCGFLWRLMYIFVGYNYLKKKKLMENIPNVDRFEQCQYMRCIDDVCPPSTTGVPKFRLNTSQRES